MILALYVAAPALLGAYALLCGRGRRAAAALCYALACVCALGLAGTGMDFSPSFTMMFLVANLFLCALAEGLTFAGRCFAAKGKAAGALAALRGLLFAAGVLLSLPSVYIYAAGDDKIDLCVYGAVIVGTLCTAGVALFQWRKGSLAGAGKTALTWLTLCAACFALACGLRSPALLPYGAGLALMAVAQVLGKGGADARSALVCLGALVASVLSVAPML